MPKDSGSTKCVRKNSLNAHRYYMEKINHRQKDITNQRFGRLTAIKCTNKTKRRSFVWECKCDCGSTTKYSVNDLRIVRSCGCLDKERLKKFADINRGITPQNALPHGVSNTRRIMSTYKNSAKRRGYQFSLSEEEFSEIILKECYYCGEKSSLFLEDKYRSDGDLHYNGIDRVDNNLGYTKDNSVPCCRYCNMSKHTRSHDDFIAWATRIHDSSIKRLGTTARQSQF